MPRYLGQVLVLRNGVLVASLRKLLGLHLRVAPVVGELLLQRLQFAPQRGDLCLPRRVRLPVRQLHLLKLLSHLLLALTQHLQRLLAMGGELSQ